MSKKPDIKQYRKDLAILKRKGLVSSNLDLRKAKPTKHYLSVIKQNRDVIEGKSFVVRIRDGQKRVESNLFGGEKVSKAKEIAAQNQVRRKGSKLIVERNGAEAVSYNAKTGRLVSTRLDKATGKRIKVDIAPRNADFEALRKQGYFFRIEFPSGLRRTWENPEEMETDMEGYHKDKDGKSLAWNWRKYVVLVKRKDALFSNDKEE